MNTFRWNPGRDGRLHKMLSTRGDQYEPSDDGPLNFSGAAWAFGEVCPKHRNIRREILRVRPETVATVLSRPALSMSSHE